MGFLTKEESDRLDAQFEQMLRDLTAKTERLIAEGKYYEACFDFCHEGLSVHEITGRGTPEGYVRFGMCSADARVRLDDLPERLQPDPHGDDDHDLFGMDAAAWPEVMKAALRPVAEHALKILKDGGSGC
jgi:hypothetical protein